MSQQAERLGVICSGMDVKNVNTLSQTAPTDKTCYVYRLTEMKEVIVVMCNTPVTAEQSYSWANEVLLYVILFL